MPLITLDHGVRTFFLYLPIYLVIRIPRFILIVIEKNFIRRYYPCSCSTSYRRPIALKIIDRYKYEWFDYFHRKPKVLYVFSYLRMWVQIFVGGSSASFVCNKYYFVSCIITISTRSYASLICR